MQKKTRLMSMLPDRPSNKLKVAIIAPSLRYVGGQAVQADLLMRLWKNDPDVEVSFLAIDPPLPGALAWAESIPGLRTILREPIYFLHLWYGLREIGIAHIFSASYWSFLLAAAPAWFFSKLHRNKSIINYRSGEARDHLQRFRSGKFVLSRVDKIVTPSSYLVDVFREFGLRAIVVPNVVDLAQFRYRERNPLRPHLICTRGFFEYYSVDVVVKAFAEVKREYPQALLDLVGGGPLESAIRRQVGASRAYRCHFHRRCLPPADRQVLRPSRHLHQRVMARQDARLAYRSLPSRHARGLNLARVHALSG